LLPLFPPLVKVSIAATHPSHFLRCSFVVHETAVSLPLLLVIENGLFQTTFLSSRLLWQSLGPSFQLFFYQSFEKPFVGCSRASLFPPPTFFFQSVQTMCKLNSSPNSPSLGIQLYEGGRARFFLRSVPGRVTKPRLRTRPQITGMSCPIRPYAAVIALLAFALFIRKSNARVSHPTELWTDRPSLYPYPRRPVFIDFSAARASVLYPAVPPRLTYTDDNVCAAYFFIASLSFTELHKALVSLSFLAFRVRLLLAVNSFSDLAIFHATFVAGNQPLSPSPPNALSSAAI